MSSGRYSNPEVKWKPTADVGPDAPLDWCDEWDKLPASVRLEVAASVSVDCAGRLARLVDARDYYGDYVTIGKEQGSEAPGYEAVVKIIQHKIDALTLVGAFMKGLADEAAEDSSNG